MELMRVLRELEDDFYSYKGYESIRSLSFHRAELSKRSIYTDLAEKYKIMDAAPNIVNLSAQQFARGKSTSSNKGSSF